MKAENEWGCITAFLIILVIAALGVIIVRLEVVIGLLDKF